MEDHIDGEVANLMERSEAGEVVDHRSKGESVVSDDDSGRERRLSTQRSKSIFGRSSSIIELWGNNFGVLGKIHLENFIWARNFINKIQDAELEVRVVVETEMSSLEVKVVAERLNWERWRELIAKVGRSGRREVERIGRHRNCHRRWGEDDVIMRNVVKRQQEQLQLRLWRCKSVEACGGGHGEELVAKNLGVEMGKYGIRANCISPFSDESKYISGINVVIDGGYSTTNVAPRETFKKLAISLRNFLSS
nr:secoisolariciresinol dehydrogenase-like [Ipomoea batatas]